jgi:BirA family biotin operon repressor/biotin-[acetyl-CoA-carboxylase] ligase
MPSVPSAPELTADPRLTAAFAGCLPGGRLAGPLLAFARVDSTQDVCRRLAAEGAPEGAVVVADYQRAGRGRGGHTWTAPPGAGVLASCLLRPPLPPARWPELTGVAATAVADAVARLTSLSPRIKDPNDVLVGDRKLAGVLGESVVGASSFVVLGIGINVTQGPADWPAGLAARAVSLAELGHPVPRPRLLAAVLAALAARYEAFLTTHPRLADEVSA